MTSRLKAEPLDYGEREAGISAKIHDWETVIIQSTCNTTSTKQK
jgi:hypothetical protein